MRSGLFILLSGIFFILVTDLLLYIQIKKYLNRKRYRLPYWGLSLCFLIGIFIYYFNIPKASGPEIYYRIALGSSIMLLVYTSKIILIIANAISWLIYTILGYNRKRKYIIRLLFTGICFCTLLYSITIGKTNYKIEHTKITLSSLPEEFNDLKIVHISDLHLGSLSQTSGNIKKLVGIINRLEPDVILFTGDMINNFADEMCPWIDELKQLHAVYGKYATLGNHDYGNYTKWLSPEAKQKNRENLETYIQQTGFTLLNNAHVPLVNGNDSLFIAGVENWGFPPFPQYGDIRKAIADIEKQFIILLSHDPAYWRSEILNHQIPLTLSGHTHAMQMGIKVGRYEWSPAKYLYKEYDGLYEQDGKYLFVSRGVGFLGFAGRIGLRPEIEEIILKRN